MYFWLSSLFEDQEPARKSRSSIVWHYKEVPRFTQESFDLTPLALHFLVHISPCSFADTDCLSIVTQVHSSPHHRFFAGRGFKQQLVAQQSTLDQLHLYSINMKTTTALLAVMASLASGHILMRTPIPMGAPNSSPLAKDGSNFPCKNDGLNWDDKSAPNVMVVGEQQKLDFYGGATHGGGSCQISITKDLSPTKNSKWMVIHSIEGGCPSDAPGNLNGDARSTAAPGFPYTIPDHPDIPPNNDYVLAWTWNNKIGQREFYMNCAYVQLKPAVKKRYEPTTPAKRDNSPLPDLFVANLAGINSCVVDEGTDVQYPNPGQSLAFGNKGNSPVNLQPPTGNCGAGSSRSAAPPAAPPAAAPAPAPAPAAASQAPAAGGAAPVASGYFATVNAPSGAAPAAATATVSPIAATPAAAPTAAAPAAQPNPATGGSTAAGSQSGPCTNEGAWACASDGKSFQRCASGAWSAAIPMAAGTKCVPGVSSTFSMLAAGAAGKRDMRSHILRRRYEQFSG